MEDQGITPAARPAGVQALDYRSAFEFAPVAVALSRERIIVDCNLRMLAMFGAQRDELVGHTFERLYPTRAEFDRTGRRILAELGAKGDAEYSDERVMRRLSDGRLSGATCRATRSTAPTRTRPASGRSRTSRAAARTAST